jgi:LmbE family N-acetylglucosaminyl deacetylase
MKKNSVGYIFEGVSRVLSIQAHHDDTDIAAGGTIARLTGEGKEVIYCTVTDGRLGTINETIPAWKFIKTRKEEQQRAAKALGVSRLIFLDYGDQTVDSTLELRKRLLDVIRDTKADVVMTHDPWKPYEGNRDHRHTGMMAVDAAGYAHHPLENTEREAEAYLVCGMCLFRPFQPDTWIDITDTFDLKLEALRQHVSQHGEAIADKVRRMNAEDGKLIKRPYAEAFKVLEPDAPYMWK